MLTVTLSQQILRLVETGIENAKSHYMSQQILRLVETGIENLNSYFVSADIVAC